MDRAWREEVPVVSLRLAIEQCLEAGTPTYLVGQAIENGLSKGFIKSFEADGLRKRLEERYAD